MQATKTNYRCNVAYLEERQLECPLKHSCEWAVKLLRSAIYDYERRWITTIKCNPMEGKRHERNNTKPPIKPNIMSFKRRKYMQTERETS